MVNTALAASFAAIAAPPAGSAAPYMVWDTDAQKFSLYAQKAFYDLALANPIEIRFNYAVYNQFPFLAYSVDNEGSLLLVRDYNNNTETIGGTDFLFLKQQGIGVERFNPIKSILFISNTIPVKNTFTELNNTQPDNSNASSLGILTDFKLDISNNSLGQRKHLLYVADNYRWLDLYGNTPLRTIDVQVYWADLQRKLYRYRIPLGDEGSMKILFRKKTTIN